MPPFRVTVAHTDEDHRNAAPFQWRGTLDSVEMAQAAVAEARKEYPVRDHTLAIEELVETKPPGDDGLQGEHEWREVDQ